MKFSPRYAKGQMAVILTLVIATLIGAMALGADVAVMYFNHLQLQKGVDAAALAGANFLEGSYTYTPTNANCGGQSDYAKEAACDYAANDGLISANNTTLTFNEPGTGLPAGAPTPNIQVIASRSNLPYLFGRVLGLNSYTVAAVATAKASGPTTSVNGLFPMGVQCTSPCSLSTLNPGTPVQFNVKFTPAPTYASGNWQWLQNSGCGSNGASCVSQGITNGMTGTFSVGDPITLDPGNKGSAGPDRQAFNSRFSTTNCPALSGANDPCNGASVNSIPQNDPCLIVVPAVDFSGSNGASSPPTIEAFADVYIEPGSTISNGNGGSNITACFVQAVTANTISSGGNPINLGSYAQPQLIE